MTLTEFFGKPFDRKYAYTIRCGGRRSRLGNRHNWDSYKVGEDEYMLTLKDRLKLQGFDDNSVLKGSQQEQWKQVGKTIPTIFTARLAPNL